MVIEVIIACWVVQWTTFSFQTDNLVDLRLRSFSKITEDVIELIGLNVVFELDIRFYNGSPCLHDEICTNSLSAVSVLILEICTEWVTSLREKIFKLNKIVTCIESNQIDSVIPVSNVDLFVNKILLGLKSSVFLFDFILELNQTNGIAKRGQSQFIIE